MFTEKSPAQMDKKTNFFKDRSHLQPNNGPIIEIRRKAAAKIMVATKTIRSTPLFDRYSSPVPPQVLPSPVPRA